MDSYNKLLYLQNLYKLQILGYEYTDNFEYTQTSPTPATVNSLAELQAKIDSCHLCNLSKSRLQSMSGYGNTQADLFFVDFTVSKLQNETNSYFVGNSGETLQRMIENVLKMRIEDIYLTHIVKCKPPHMHPLSSEEVDTCKTYIFSQVEFVQPKIIVALGAQAYEALSHDSNFEDVRGHLIDFKGMKLIPIYHPQYLVQNPALKKTAQQDLLSIKNYLHSLQN